MFFIDDEERDLDEELDEEDADLDEDNSDDEEDDVDEDDDSEEEEDDEDEDDEEDDSKKKSKKSKKSDRQDSKNQNRDNARRRKSSKKHIDNQQRQTDDRISKLEKADKDRKVLDRKRTFGYEHGLSPKQVDYVFRNTKRPTTKFLEQPEIAAGLRAIAEAEGVSKNTSRGSGSGKVFKNDKGKSKNWTELTPAERQARLADRRRAILENKRG